MRKNVSYKNRVFKKSTPFKRTGISLVQGEDNTFSLFKIVKNQT